MNFKRLSLWHRFIGIAQPYFFPAVPGGLRRMLLLMIMLMAFLMGFLFVIVTALTVLEIITCLS